MARERSTPRRPGTSPCRRRRLCADVLPSVAASASTSEQVVLDLEGEADGSPVGVQAREVLVPGEGEEAAGRERGADQAAGLALVDPRDEILRGMCLLLRLQIRDLAADHAGRADRVHDRVDGLHLRRRVDLLFRVAGERPEAVGQERVPCEDRDRLSEDDVAVGTPRRRSSLSSAGRSSWMSE